MTRVLAAIDALDGWLDSRRLCWKGTICAGIACVAATLMLAVGEVVVNGEVPARVGAYMSVVTPAVLAGAFCAGLAAEWLAKHRRAVAA